MHVHIAFFWLDKNLSDADLKNFETGLDQLTRDPNIHDRRIGKPAQTDRPVIDTSYDYGITLQFRNLAAHDAYQFGDIHADFIKNHQSKWTDVKVYDIEELG